VVRAASRRAGDNRHCSDGRGVLALKALEIRCTAYPAADDIRRKAPMRIFIFKTEKSPTLRAFSDDQGGHNLPAQFRPWHAIGVVSADSDPPHNLNRGLIEASITSDGFQLWRMKVPA
jgi:hypothetical protein